MILMPAKKTTLKTSDLVLDLNACVNATDDEALPPPMPTSGKRRSKEQQKGRKKNAKDLKNSTPNTWEIINGCNDEALQKSPNNAPEISKDPEPELHIEWDDADHVDAELQPSTTKSEEAGNIEWTDDVQPQMDTASRAADVEEASCEFPGFSHVSGHSQFIKTVSLSEAQQAHNNLDAPIMRKTDSNKDKKSKKAAKSKTKKEPANGDNFGMEWDEDPFTSVSFNASKSQEFSMEWADDAGQAEPPLGQITLPTHIPTMSLEDAMLASIRPMKDSLVEGSQSPPEVPLGAIEANEKKKMQKSSFKSLFSKEHEDNDKKKSIADVKFNMPSRDDPSHSVSPIKSPSITSSKISYANPRAAKSEPEPRDSFQYPLRTWQDDTGSYSVTARFFSADVKPRKAMKKGINNGNAEPQEYFIAIFLLRQLDEENTNNQLMVEFEKLSFKDKEYLEGIIPLSDWKKWNLKIAESASKVKDTVEPRRPDAVTGKIDLPPVPPPPNQHVSCNTQHPSRLSPREKDSKDLDDILMVRKSKAKAGDAKSKTKEDLELEDSLRSIVEKVKLASLEKPRPKSPVSEVSTRPVTSVNPVLQSGANNNRVNEHASSKAQAPPGPPSHQMMPSAQQHPTRTIALPPPNPSSNATTRPKNTSVTLSNEEINYLMSTVDRMPSRKTSVPQPLYNNQVPYRGPPSMMSAGPPSIKAQPVPPVQAHPARAPSLPQYQPTRQVPQLQYRASPPASTMAHGQPGFKPAQPVNQSMMPSTAYQSNSYTSQRIAAHPSVNITQPLQAPQRLPVPQQQPFAHERRMSAPNMALQQGSYPSQQAPVQMMATSTFHQPNASMDHRQRPPVQMQMPPPQPPMSLPQTNARSGQVQYNTQICHPPMHSTQQYYNQGSQGPYQMGSQQQYIPNGYPGNVQPNPPETVQGYAPLPYQQQNQASSYSASQQPTSAYLSKY